MLTMLVVLVDRLDHISQCPAADIDTIILKDLAITREVGEKRHG